MPFLYDTAVGLYHLGIRCAAPWSTKARAWRTGREGLWDRLEAKAPALRGCLWMHCASVGEFEQGRPVLEAIKAARPDLPVLLTFFSPSGYQALKDLPLATHVDHLPPDGAADAQRLVALVRPRACVFVRYEFWYHHLHALKRAEVPTFLLSATFRAGQPFFRWYGGAWRRMLRCFTHLFTQDEASRALLARIGLGERTSVSGDTRLDRVLAIARSAPELPIAQAFRGEGPVLTAGSTWPPDEALLRQALAAAPMKCLIAPHELGADQLEAIERDFPKPLIRWSEAEAAGDASAWAHVHMRTLLVDRMGLLARLYRYGDIAYLGGGFSDGIHNVLEAAAWGRPVLFGPRHRKFPEAQALIDAGAAVMVRDARELGAALHAWGQDPHALQRASAAARGYVERNAGATARVTATLLPYL